jgi:predicted metal-dependent HD superfamily phosphohydrolase
MEHISRPRWRATCDALQLRSADAEYEKVIRGWKSWGRRYHTLEHLNACLRQFDEFRELAQYPAEVEIALWFHDAVYKTRKSDNEAKSAEWAAEFLSAHGASREVIDRVTRLIMATAHNVKDLSGDATLVVDVDLSILGQTREIYDQFEKNVRKEYWWVPRKRFVAGRTAILKSFLDRPKIYYWPVMREKLEARARENLERAIRALEVG